MQPKATKYDKPAFGVGVCPGFFRVDFTIFHFGLKKDFFINI